MSKSSRRTAAAAPSSTEVGLSISKKSGCFKAPISSSLLWQDLSLSAEEIKKIKENAYVGSTILECTDPIYSMKAIDCHKDGSCFTHDILCTLDTTKEFKCLYKKVKPYNDKHFQINSSKQCKKRKRENIKKNHEETDEMSDLEESTLKRIKNNHAFYE